jgi:hypothetical protein
VLAIRGAISPNLAGLCLVYALDLTRFLKHGTAMASKTESDLNRWGFWVWFVMVGCLVWLVGWLVGEGRLNGGERLKQGGSLALHLSIAGNPRKARKKSQNPKRSRKSSKTAENPPNPPSVERVVQYLEPTPEAPNETPPAVAAALPPGWPAAGAVCVSKLELRYRPGLPLVLRGVSFDIAAGEKVGRGARFWSSLGGGRSPFAGHFGGLGGSGPPFNVCG